MTSPNMAKAPESYIGSFVSLISKYDIRYEGVLYHLDVNDSTIGLQNVKSFGTEGRKKDGPQVLPSEKVYDYILFRGSDIKDLEVKSSPPPKEEQIYIDPAIIQYAGISTNSPSLSSVGGKTLTELNAWQDTPALTTKVITGALPSQQAGSQVGQLSHPHAIQNAASPSFSVPMNRSEYSRPSNTIPPIPFQSPSTMSSPLTLQSGIQTSGTNSSPVLGLIYGSGSVAHSTPLVTPNHLHPNFSSSPIPVQCYPSLMPLTPSFKGPLPSTDAYLTENNQNISLLPSCQDPGTTGAQISGKAVPGPVVAHTAQTMHYPASSFLGSACGPMITPSPSLLTPDQFVASRSHVLSSTQVYPNKKDMGDMRPTSYNSPSDVAPHLTQPPLLPLPTSNLQFSEEFDFEAMNDKFKKDEVWGYLGKAKHSDKLETVEDNASDQNSGGKESDGLVKNAESQPAYRRDDFFDTISCNSFNRGTPGGQNRFSERMKMDTETFGNFRHNQGYGAGRRGNYRDANSGGRENAYVGRGRGNFRDANSGGWENACGGRGYGGNMRML